MENNVERIRAAAVRLPDGTIKIGPDHGYCLKPVPKDLNDFEAGFLTSAGRFVDRVEAGKIAWKAGQLKLNPEDEGIISEEIWFYGPCVWNEEAQEYVQKT